MSQIPENVNRFMSHCSEIVGCYESEMFNIGLYQAFIDSQSPIEQLFETALTMLLKLEDLEFYSQEKDGHPKNHGVLWASQFKIGDYFADFVLFSENIGDKRKVNKVVVELDGHNFHDRNEKQRRYEKARDRYFQKCGFNVFHFTGSEIVKDPLDAVCECVGYLIGVECESLKSTAIMYGYDNEAWR